MKKLVYTVLGYESAEQQELLLAVLPDVLRAYGSDGKIETDVASASIAFGVPRNTANEELEQSINAVLAVHGMQLLPAPGVRYYAYQGPKSKRKSVPTSALVASLISAVSLTLVITMLLTAVISSAYWNAKLTGSILGGVTNNENVSAITDDKTLSLVDQLIRDYAYEGVDQEALMESVIKAYV